MKQAFCAVLFCVCLVMGVQARCANLPSACGDDKIKFDVKTAKHQPAPAPPTAGQAQVVFIEDETEPVGPFMYATVRFGLDGAWEGANNGNSYFTVDVAPGEHHLCANWQSAMRTFNKDVDLASFIAKPGKVYYFRAKIVVGKNFVDFNIERVNGDEGKYMAQNSKFSTSTQKK